MSYLHTPLQDLKPGDQVDFQPGKGSLNWAKGIRTVAGFEGDMVRLVCGNIKLLAKKEELKKYEHTQQPDPIRK